MVARSWMALPIMQMEDRMKITPRIMHALRRKRKEENCGETTPLLSQIEEMKTMFLRQGFFC